ncbi:hypothetical protein EYF80_011830 [Liparis tanakae]|uniref:Uncharacterized protein n=1 Tax=Liparis tanakae TaxID=230148 RepID=A0A4Z2IJD6_9TELE|nr:hypothetical protein EYF80_011830 [Liparis tanakae]
MLPMLSELNEKLQDRVGRERQEEKKPARLKLASVVRSSLHEDRCDRTAFAFRQSQRPQDDREALICIEHYINTAEPFLPNETPTTQEVMSLCGRPSPPVSNRLREREEDKRQCCRGEIPHNKELDPHEAELDPHEAELDPHEAELDPHEAELDPHEAELDGFKAIGRNELIGFVESSQPGSCFVMGKLSCAELH